jgi:hypothetical protein
MYILPCIYLKDIHTLPFFNFNLPFGLISIYLLFFPFYILTLFFFLIYFQMPLGHLPHLPWYLSSHRVFCRFLYLLRSLELRNLWSIPETLTWLIYRVRCLVYLWQQLSHDIFWDALSVDYLPDAVTLWFIYVMGF